ncbi:MAG: hypothetical protein MZW92_04340 [Comamonadaceae bacterium]|nr:hypothetical protein [Comamonadaceae bacterium]
MLRRLRLRPGRHRRRRRAHARRATSPGAHVRAPRQRPVRARRPAATGATRCPIAQRLRRHRSAGWGIGNGTQVVAYDAQGGAVRRARCGGWLRWLGHDAVARARRRLAGLASTAGGSWSSTEPAPRAAAALSAAGRRSCRRSTRRELLAARSAALRCCSMRARPSAIDGRGRAARPGGRPHPGRA